MAHEKVDSVAIECQPPCDVCTDQHSGLSAPVQIISPEEARNVLYHFGHPAGWEAGSFTSSLISAVARADQMNLARLSLGFPGLVAAVRIAQERVGGIDELVKIAEVGK